MFLYVICTIRRGERERIETMHHRSIYGADHMMGYMGYNGFSIFIIVFIIIIFVLLLIGFLIMNRLKKELDEMKKLEQNEAITVLQRRLAAGEIDEAQYWKLYNVLNGNK